MDDVRNETVRGKTETRTGTEEGGEEERILEGKYEEHKGCGGGNNVRTMILILIWSS